MDENQQQSIPQKKQSTEQSIPQFGGTNKESYFGKVHDISSIKYHMDSVDNLPKISNTNLNQFGSDLVLNQQIEDIKQDLDQNIK